MSDQIKKAFLHPLDEFTPIPFWFWNNALDEKEITRQIEDFHSKGINGFVIHPRIGIPEDIPYLSDRFMHYVKHAVSEAARLDMKIVLYDEAMYPSGSAHGMVVQGNPEFAARCIRMDEYPDIMSIPQPPEGDSILCAQAAEKDFEGRLIPETIHMLEIKDGKITDSAVHPSTQRGRSGRRSILVFTEGFSGGTIRGIHMGEDDGEPGAPASGDLMNPAAMEKFIRITYDRYYEVLKEYFGTTVIAMFTDEPDELGRCHRPGSKPWTYGFLDWWKRRGGKEEDLPLLWLDGEGCEQVRRQFKKAVNQRLEHSYYSQISRWCEDHGIALTGHPQKSDDIGFLRYFHIPGQDIVWRWVAPEQEKGVTGRDSTMAKCSSDAARHGGRRRNSNECFGCCGPDGIQWAFRAGDMKWYLDWMFVRGVNLLYPHAFFYSLEGEKRFGERPPDVGPHSIWWQDYRAFSDYIKRMSWLMTDSVNTTPIAMLCEEDHLPWQLARELYRNQIEFNYLEDTLLRNGACSVEDGCLKICRQSYRVLVVENPQILTAELMELLQPFLDGGGQIIVFLSESDACCADTVTHRNISIITCCPDIIPALDVCCRREIRIEPACPDLRVSHVVKEGCHFYVLVNEGETAITGRIQIPAVGNAEIWDPWNGTCGPAQTTELPDSTFTEIPVVLERRESLILYIASEEAESPDRSLDSQEYASPAPYPVSAGFYKSAGHCKSDSPQCHADNTFLRVQNGTPCHLNLSWQVTSAIQSAAIKEAGLSKYSGSIPSLVLPTGMGSSSLTSWTKWTGMEDFSGAVVYETSFLLDSAIPETGWILDLGEVQETVHLQVNGKDAGFRLWGPYRFDISPFVTSGSNHIRLEVTNTLANGMSGAKLPSGLLGPVKLLKYD